MSESMTSESKPSKVTLWLVLIAAFLGWMFDGLEMGLYPLAARPALRDILATVTTTGERVFPAEAIVGAWYSSLVSLFLLGAATGGLLFGWLGDRIGRVRTMALSIAFYSVFTGCVYFANAPWQLGVFRFLAALGMGGEWALGVALVMECWPEKYRPILAGVIGAAANVGFLAISLLGVFFQVDEDSWRWMMLAGAAPGLLAIFVISFIPESQRWKESVQKERSKPLREIFGTRLVQPTLLGIAFASVALIATWGAVSGFLPVWTDQLAGGERSIKITANVPSYAEEGLDLLTLESVKDVQVSDTSADNAAAATTDTVVSKPNYQLKKTHTLEADAKAGEEVTYHLTVTNRGTSEGTGITITDMLPIDRLDAASVQIEKPQQGEVSFDVASGKLTWSLGTLEFKDPKAKSRVQALLSIGAILGCFVGPLLANWLGRRPAYFILCLTSLVSCGYLFGFLREYNFTFLAVTAVVGLVSASFYGWLPLYLPELFPTRVRATGQGVAFNFARIFAAGGAWLTGTLIVVYHGSYPLACATIISVYLVGMVLIWFAPETKGKPLPE